MRVAIIVGSESDRVLGDQVASIMEEFGVEYEYIVASAHRSPDQLDKYLDKCDADVFIAIAGLSAALPGYVASKTLKPVIGVPRAVSLSGLDSLLSMAQMPPGVPVATVGIDNAKNAAYLAIRMLAMKDESLMRKLEEKMRELRAKSFKVIKELDSTGKL